MKKVDRLTGTTTDFIRQTRDDLDTLAGMLEDGSRQQDASTRTCTILEHRMEEIEHENKQLKTMVNEIQNKTKENNLKIGGKKEEDGEDLKNYVLEIAGRIAPGGLDQAAIVSAYRLGKRPNPHNNNQANAHKARTILVTFRSVQDRNQLYHARTKLRNFDQFKQVYLNDDINAATRKIREDYRAVAALVRCKDKEVGIHDYGLVI